MSQTQNTTLGSARREESQVLASARSMITSARSARTHATLSTSEPELTKKIEDLERELTDLTDTSNQLNEEHRALEEAIKASDQELLETTQQLESESDTLSNARRELREKRNEVLLLQRKNQTMDEVTALNRLTGERRNDKEARERTNVVDLGDDTYRRIMELTTDKRLKLQHVEDLKHEIDTLSEILEKKVTALEYLDQQVNEFQAKEDRAYELECLKTELIQQVEELEKDIATRKQVLDMKMKTIGTLSNQIDEWKEFEEDHVATLRVLEFKEKELSDLQLELESVQETCRQKEEEIESVLDSRDLVPVKTLEGDKVFLRGEMKKKQDEKLTLEKTIKWQEKQIQMLQTRLQNLNTALKESKLLRSLKKGSHSRRSTEERPDSDRVPVPLYLAMIYNIQLLEKRSKNIQFLLEEKDLQTEAMVTKLDQLLKEKQDAELAFKKEQESLLAQIQEASFSIQSLEESFKVEENDLKARNISIKKRLFSVQPKPVPTFSKA